MPTRLTDQEIEQQLTKVSGWKREGHRIQKQYGFPSFPDGLAFLVRLGFECEAQDHHPDITVDYKRVTLAYWTHSEGGLTEKDFTGADTADRIAAGFLKK
jgi:4a-hydroxytetrahydrobiopterin dehydratase